jgi:hypothetical protein
MASAEVPVRFFFVVGKVPSAKDFITGPLCSPSTYDRVVAAAKAAWEAAGKVKATASWARFEYSDILWKITHPSTFVFNVTAVQDLSLEPCCGCDEIHPAGVLGGCDSCEWSFCLKCLDKDSYCADCRD